MRKSSKSISLALIGSAFLVGGCSGPAAEESEWGPDEDVVRAGADPNAQAVATGTGQYHHDQHVHHSGGRMASGIGGALIGSQIGRAMGGGSAVAPGPRPGYVGGGAAAPSARGGFGSSAGHASSGGHASSSS